MSSGFDWGAPVSWLLVVIGWIVINSQNNHRETRKEIRAALNDVYELLNEIEDDAVTYHSGTGDLVLSRKIKRRLGQIHTRIQLALRNTVECSCASEIAAFRKAVTLHNFDSATHMQLSVVDTVFDEITGTRERLISVIELAYLKKYP